MTYVYIWWRGEDSNLRRLSRQIYSLLPLTAWVPLRCGWIVWYTSVDCQHYPTWQTWRSPEFQNWRIQAPLAF